jgi:uncharacterized tellurite resistance protein B-like protein
MENGQLNDILSLLAATIFADGRVFSSEIETFLKAANTLTTLRKIEPKLSEAKLLAWYEMNKEDIREKITTPYFKDWFYVVVENLSDVEDKGSILSVMKDISQADGEVHVSERALVTLAARHWNIDFTA